MNTVVRKNVLAARIPEEFRLGISPDQQVTVTVEWEGETAAAGPTRAQLAELIRAARQAPPIDDDPVGRIRALRDEWDT